MAITSKSVTGRYLECWTPNGFPQWGEQSFATTIRGGDSSYRERIRRQRKKGVELLFSPTAHYCDSQLVFDTLYRAESLNTPLECVGSRPGPGGVGTVSTSAGSRRRWADVSCWSGNTPFNGATSYWTHNASYDKLWNKVKSEKVNLAMMLVEYRQTASMFQTLARRLVNINRNIRRGRFRLASGSRNGPANEWLLYRYGITPFVSDVNGIADLFLKKSSVTPLIRQVKVSQTVTQTQHGSHTPSSAYVSNLKPLPFIWFQKSRFRDSVWLEYEQANLKILSETGFTNPLALAWEVIPYSFVVDWFIDMGSQLSALDALTGTKRWAGTRAYVRQLNLQYPSAPWASVAKRYNRSVISTGPTLSVPRWSPSPSWKRFVDSIALVRQKAR